MLPARNFDMLRQLAMFAAIAGCLLNAILLAGGCVVLVRPISK
jgi:hypothetical protein